MSADQVRADKAASIAADDGSRTPESHSVVVCPVCHKSLPIGPGEHAQQVFERHEAAGECGVDQDAAATDIDPDEAMMIEQAQRESLETLSSAAAA